MAKLVGFLENAAAHNRRRVVKPPVHPGVCILAVGDARCLSVGSTLKYRQGMR